MWSFLVEHKTNPILASVLAPTIDYAIENNLTDVYANVVYNDEQDMPEELPRVQLSGKLNTDNFLFNLERYAETFLSHQHRDYAYERWFPQQKLTDVKLHEHNYSPKGFELEVTLFFGKEHQVHFILNFSRSRVTAPQKPVGYILGFSRENSHWFEILPRYDTTFVGNPKQWKEKAVETAMHVFLARGGKQRMSWLATCIVYKKRILDLQWWYGEEFKHTPMSRDTNINDFTKAEKDIQKMYPELDLSNFNLFNKPELIQHAKGIIF